MRIIVQSNINDEIRLFIFETNNIMQYETNQHSDIYNIRLKIPMTNQNHRQIYMFEKVFATK